MRARESVRGFPLMSHVSGSSSCPERSPPPAAGAPTAYIAIRLLLASLPASLSGLPRGRGALQSLRQTPFWLLRRWGRKSGTEAERRKMSTLTLGGRSVALITAWITASLHAGSTAREPRGGDAVACACHQQDRSQVVPPIGSPAPVPRLAPEHSTESNPVVCRATVLEWRVRHHGASVPQSVASGDVRELTSLPAIRTPRSRSPGRQIDAAPCLLSSGRRLRPQHG